MLRITDATSAVAALPLMTSHCTLYRAAPLRQLCREGMPGLGLAVRRACSARHRAAHVKCNAAAIVYNLQQEATAAAGGHSNTTAKPATTANVNHNSDSSASDGVSPSVITSTAAAVAAKFPAVPVLPTPPGSGSLQDVVPYLLHLALQERHLAWRLAAAVSCMVVAKLAGISLPLVFKGAVDAMSVSSGSAVVMAQAALAAVLSYGALDCMRVMAKEAQSPIFAPVSQAVTRRVAYHTFSHVLSLDTKFHIDRRTGRVSRILERGTRSIGVLYRALIFTFLPTGLELGAVAGLLASRFGALLAGLLAATFAAYVTWTVAMTQRATDVRKEVNHLDNQASSKAVDALLNFETVTLFNNQRLEVGLYDNLLRDLRSASLRAETLSAGLNAGQGLILATGMASILAFIIASGSASGGDLVMASGLILQLWAPLQFLGWFYRELRAALVDMEEFFQILRTSSNIQDGNAPLPLEQYTSLTATTATATTATLGPSSNNDTGSAAMRPPSPQMEQHQKQQLQQQQQQYQELASSGVEERLTSNSHSNSSNGNGVNAVRPMGPLVAAGDATSPPGGLAVELTDVCFGYSPERQILHGVSLRVAPGESVAVVGSSGSGKSTILKLVTRLYDVWPDAHGPHSTAVTAVNGATTEGHHLRSRSCSTSSSTSRGSTDTRSAITSCTSSSSSDSSSNGAALGCSDGEKGAGNQGGTPPPHEGEHTGLTTQVGGSRSTSSSVNCSSSGGGGGGSSSSTSSGQRPSGVYINGVDVRQLQLADLRSAIAVVPQDTALCYDSIRENIRYGRPDAGDDEVEAAARMARLHDTVMALPDQYDTVVGERGLKLSGGEKQRVAIARAFLRSPRLLICDEATSALDSGTEVAIMESLKELARGRSALFVAHRLSTVRNCDRIVVLRNGLVVEEGSHDELMARRGEYAAMWQLQANQTPGEDDGGGTDSDVEMYDMEEGGANLREPDQDMEGQGEGAMAWRRRPVALTDSLDDIDAGMAGSAAATAAGYIPRAAVLAAAEPAAVAGSAATATTAAVGSAVKDV